MLLQFNFNNLRFSFNLKLHFKFFITVIFRLGAREIIAQDDVLRVCAVIFCCSIFNFYLQFK